MNKNLILSAATIAFLTGCAGYNTAIFATKSNAGLDIDTKTPTAEITVARKESVIEPSFEEGKVPPVMASFKPHIGFGSGFQNFFFGVDQTFAGGDAAVIMSKLYDKPDSSFDPQTEDSTLVLSQPPKYRSFFRRIPGPGESRPFVFTTDTILGLKIAWSGTSGQVPDSIKAGFNRKEFAWAPLTIRTEIANNRTQAFVTMPPFMASIESRINGDTGKSGTTEVAALQYFATGEAARQLSLKRDVREAMLARMDPNAAAQKARFGTVLDQPGDVGIRAQIVLSEIYDGLKEMANANDLQAKEHVKALDSLGNLAGPLTWYDDNGGTVIETTLNAPAVKNFQTFKIYQSALRGSIAILSNALAHPPFQIQHAGVAAVQVAAGSPEANNLAITLGRQKQMDDDLSAALRHNSDAAAAVKYYSEQLSH